MANYNTQLTGAEETIFGELERQAVSTFSVSQALIRD